MEFSFLFCKCLAWALSPEDLDISNQDLTLSVLDGESVRSDPLLIQLRQRTVRKASAPSCASLLVARVQARITRALDFKVSMRRCHRFL